MKNWEKIAVVTGISAVAMASVGTAHAGSFALKERSARAQGLSFAGATAGSGGLSSMGFNPAALGLVTNLEIAGGLSAVQPIADGTVVSGAFAGQTVDASQFGGVANGYVGYRPLEDFVIGLAIYTPFGLATQYPASWAGAGDAITSKLLTLAISPTVAYQPTPELTFGAAIDILYADARLTNAGINLDGDDISIGFSAGVIWEPRDGTTIGAAYKHGHDLVLDGTAAGALTRGAVLPVTAAAELPGVISVGVTQAITDDFRVMGEAQWMDWSAFDRIDVALGAGLADPQNYDDAFFLALGGEYDVTPALTVRAGAAWDQTPTDGGILPGTPPVLGITNRTARIPDEDRVWLSVGATYDVSDSMSVDFGYSYLFTLNDARVGLRTAPGSTVVYDGGAHIFSVGGSVRF